jgi:hypothetical protein
MINTKSDIKKVAKNGPTNARTISISSFFITFSLIYFQPIKAKIMLSHNELELVCNRDIILTKNRIVDEVYDLFGTLSEDYKTILIAHVDDDNIKSIAAKIYKGERYKQLPYVMMDYPRYFTKQDVFAIRSFFWWGNYFSISLHLSGRYLNNYRHQLVEWMHIPEAAHWFFNNGVDEWSQDIANDEFVEIGSLTGINEKLIAERNFIRIVKKIPLKKWDEANAFYITSFEALIKIFEA